jgi:hypothetical protein
MNSNNLLTKNQIPTIQRTVQKVPLQSVSLKKRFLQTALLILFNLFLAEIAARFLVVLAKPPETLAKSYDLKYQMAQRLPKTSKPTLLVMGDSLEEFGIYPEWLENRLRHAGYEASVQSFASPGNTPERSLFLLKTAIKAGYKPKLIIYDLHPRIFNQNFISDPVQTGEKPFSQTYVGHCLYRHQASAVQCALEKQFYLLRYRNYFKELFFSIPDDFSHVHRLVQQTNQRNLIDTDISQAGWAPGYSVLDNAQFLQKYDQAKFYTKIAPDFDKFQWTEDAFAPFYHYCQSQKIPLVFVWLPEHPVTEKYYRYFHLSKGYFSKAFSHYGERTHVPFLSLHDAFSEAENFHDPDHLNAVGAISLTQKLAERLQEKNYQSVLSPFLKKKP